MRLEAPPLEAVNTEHPDDVRAKALATLMLSPEVEVIGRTLCNVERRRLGLFSVLRLDALEPEEAAHYREQAVFAIQLLDREQADEAIYAAAKCYAIRTYGSGFDGLSEHKRGFCVTAARSICNMFRCTLSGHLPLSGAEARGWRALEKKLDANRLGSDREAEVRELDARICDEAYERLGSRTARDLARAIRAENKH